jgi:hypothetical protein
MTDFTLIIRLQEGPFFAQNRHFLSYYYQTSLVLFWVILVDSGTFCWIGKGERSIKDDLSLKVFKPYFTMILGSPVFSYSFFTDPRQRLKI